MLSLPHNHLKISLLISLGNSSGSGFLYRTEKNVYLVTAKHVLYDDLGELRSKEIEIVCQGVNSPEEDIIRYRINLSNDVPKYHLSADVAIIKIGTVLNSNEKTQMNILESIEVLQKGTLNPSTVIRKSILTFKEVMISNDIYVFGYPTSLGIESSRQFDPSKPLLRKGIVANVHESAKTIILDCPVYSGNSGGPVIQVSMIQGMRHLHVIGIVSQYIPYVLKWKSDRERITHLEYLNSGYSVATSFDSVLEIIEE